MISEKLTVQDIERKDFPPEYLLDRVEELAVRVYGLTNERDELDAKLAAVTAERDELRTKLDEYALSRTVRFVPVHIERELSALRKWKNAVPVEAIIAYRANSDESEGMIRNGDHEAFADFAESMRTLDAWLETQVTP